MDLEIMKDEVVSKLRLDLMPEQLLASEAVADLSENEYAESVKLFSTMYRHKHRKQAKRSTFNVAITLSKTGTPDSGVLLTLEGESDDAPSGTPIASAVISRDEVYGSAVAITKEFDIGGHLGSYTTYYLRVQSQATFDSQNTFSLYGVTESGAYRNGVGKYKPVASSTWTTHSNVHMYFDIDTPNWIFPDYPKSSLSDMGYPRIAVDVVGRPRVIKRYIDHRLAEEVVRFSILCYSRYVREIDKVVSEADYCMKTNTIAFDNMAEVLPRSLGSINITRGNLYVREVTVDGRFKERHG